MEADAFDRVTLLQHPLVSRDLSILRDRETGPERFRQAMHRLSLALAMEACRSLPVTETTIRTPLTETTGAELGRDVVIIPILRAGLGMADAFLDLLPEAIVGHLGMYRDESTHRPIDYYASLPDAVSGGSVLLIDPMLATGGTAAGALDRLKREGAQHLQLISLISAPEGIRHLQDQHPDVPVITAAIDEKLNEDAYIVPGLGDAGDRFFGTL